MNLDSTPIWGITSPPNIYTGTSAAANNCGHIDTAALLKQEATSNSKGNQ